jgi:hypothetical protein
MSMQFRSVCFLSFALTVSIPLQSAAQLHVCDGESCGAYRDARDLVERSLASPKDPLGFLRVSSHLYDLAAWNPSLPDDQRLEMISTGIRALDRALVLRPGYPDALIYKSLFLRLRATLERDAALQGTLSREADELGSNGRSCDASTPNGRGTDLAEPSPDLYGNRL